MFELKQALTQPSKQHKALSTQSTSGSPTLKQVEFLPWQASIGGNSAISGQLPVGIITSASESGSAAEATGSEATVCCWDRTGKFEALDPPLD